MIYFAFIDLGDQTTPMAALEAQDDEAAMAEARARLQDYPGARCAHVYNGDEPVGTVEPPAFGFSGVNHTVDFGPHPEDPRPVPALSPEDSPASA